MGQESMARALATGDLQTYREELAGTPELLQEDAILDFPSKSLLRERQRQRFASSDRPTNLGMEDDMRRGVDQRRQSYPGEMSDPGQVGFATPGVLPPGGGFVVVDGESVYIDPLTFPNQAYYHQLQEAWSNSSSSKSGGQQPTTTTTPSSQPSTTADDPQQLQTDGLPSSLATPPADSAAKDGNSPMPPNHAYAQYYQALTENTDMSYRYRKRLVRNFPQTPRKQVG